MSELGSITSHTLQNSVSETDSPIAAGVPAFSLLRQDIVVHTHRRTLPVWQSVVLGKASIEADQYRRDLRAAGEILDSWTEDMLQSGVLPCAREELSLFLVALSVAELGFPEGARYGVICERAQKRSLLLLPAETGPALRLQYARPTCPEWIGIGMTPIPGWDGNPFIFALTNTPGLGLRLAGYYSPLDYFWSAEHQFVFARAA